MRSSLLIFILFLLGVIGGRLIPADYLGIPDRLSLLVLYLLLFLVGLHLGADNSNWQLVRQAKLRLLLVPGAIIVGTLLGVSLIPLVISSMGWREALAVGAGFGYYSLSSVVISQLHGEALGVVALLANILREMLTLLFAPLLVRLGGSFAPIAAGGATAMDTTLPIINQFSGPQYAIIAVMSGIVLTLIVPLLVTLILTVPAP